MRVGEILHERGRDVSSTCAVQSSIRQFSFLDTRTFANLLVWYSTQHSKALASIDMRKRSRSCSAHAVLNWCCKVDTEKVPRLSRACSRPFMVQKHVIFPHLAQRGGGNGKKSFSFICPSSELPGLLQSSRNSQGSSEPAAE